MCWSFMLAMIYIEYDILAHASQPLLVAVVWHKRPSTFHRPPFDDFEHRRYGLLRCDGTFKVRSDDSEMCQHFFICFHLFSCCCRLVCHQCCNINGWVSLTSFGGRIDQARAYCQEYESFGLILCSILCYNHIQSGLRNSIGGLAWDPRCQNEIGVAHATTKSDDLLGCPFPKKRKEGVDGVYNTYDINVELRRQC